jgi:hypothetical protein
MVTKEEEKQDMKDEKHSVTQNSGGEEDISPSSLIRKPRWILHTLRDLDEAPMNVIRKKRHLKKFYKYMVLMSSIIDLKLSHFEKAIYQWLWCDAMVEE